MERRVIFENGQLVEEYVYSVFGDCPPKNLKMPPPKEITQEEKINAVTNYVVNLVDFLNFSEFTFYMKKFPNILKTKTVFDTCLYKSLSLHYSHRRHSDTYKNSTVALEKFINFYFEFFADVLRKGWILKSTIYNAVLQRLNLNIFKKLIEYFDLQTEGFKLFSTLCDAPNYKKFQVLLLNGYQTNFSSGVERLKKMRLWNRNQHKRKIVQICEIWKKCSWQKKILVYCLYKKNLSLLL
jgi:hypothetical protein